jgi:hypothetical protein
MSPFNTTQQVSNPFNKSGTTSPFHANSTFNQNKDNNNFASNNQESGFNKKPAILSFAFNQSNAQNTFNQPSNDFQK